MNSDNFFSIGHTHKVCEDFALSSHSFLNGEEHLGSAFAIVCDGCSSSADVDIGARLLAISARDYSPYALGRDDVDAEFIGTSIVNKAYHALSTFVSLNPSALDATLLMACVNNGKARVMAFGDGVIVHKSGSGTTIYHIDYAGFKRSDPASKISAPFYLSYTLRRSRTEGYAQEMAMEKTIETTKDGVTTTEKVHYADPFELKFDVASGDTISVISDGINSFNGPDGMPLNYLDVVPEFIGFKQLNGVFVERRMNMFKRKCAKDGITHDDDISVATIIV